jgi:hypothetical protein
MGEAKHLLCGMLRVKGIEYNGMGANELID